MSMGVSKTSDGELKVSAKVTGSNAVVTAVSVATSAQALSALLTAASGSVKSGRVAVELQNLGAGVVYVGPSGVTTSTGRKLDSAVGDGAWSIPLDADSDVYLIGDAAATVIVTQV